jgi:hypothetical protein
MKMETGERVLVGFMGVVVGWTAISSLSAIYTKGEVDALQATLILTFIVLAGFLLSSAITGKK